MKSEALLLHLWDRAGQYIDTVIRHVCCFSGFKATLCRNWNFVWTNIVNGNPRSVTVCQTSRRGPSTDKSLGHHIVMCWELVSWSKRVSCCDPLADITSDRDRDTIHPITRHCYFKVWDHVFHIAQPCIEMWINNLPEKKHTIPFIHQTVNQQKTRHWFMFWYMY